MLIFCPNCILQSLSANFKELSEEYAILVIATKIALKDISPITIVWMRFAMGVIILGLAVTMRKQFILPNKSEWEWAILPCSVFLGITFHQ